MAMGRPKLEIARTKDVHIRLTQFEFEKLERIAKKKEISKTEAVLQGIDLLIHYKPKRIAKKNVDEILRERGALTAD